MSLCISLTLSIPHSDPLFVPLSLCLCLSLSRSLCPLLAYAGKRNGLGLINDGALVQEFLSGKEYVIDKVSRAERREERAEREERGEQRMKWVMRAGIVYDSDTNTDSRHDTDDDVCLICSPLFCRCQKTVCTNS